MKIPRYFQRLDSYLKPNKVLVIYGPRQVGKTTLLTDYLQKTKLKYRLDSGEDVRIQEILESHDFRKIRDYARGYELLAIDEAQKIRCVGDSLKIIVDQIPGIYVIATGSSSFDLAGQVGEPLTGRKITLILYPVAQMELQELYTPFEMRERLEEFLIFGAYPEVVAATDTKEKARILTEITSSYLLKDILVLDRVKSSKILLDLLRLLAFQIGNEVSLSEIAQKIGIDYKTVARYIDRLEKNFVLFMLRGYSRNLRSEMTKRQSIIFSIQEFGTPWSPILIHSSYAMTSECSGRISLSWKDKKNSPIRRFLSISIFGVPGSRKKSTLLKSGKAGYSLMSLNGVGELGNPSLSAMPIPMLNFML